MPVVLLIKWPTFVLITWHTASGDGGEPHGYKRLYSNSLTKFAAVSPRRAVRV
jgi:hypothetical protein